MAKTPSKVATAATTEGMGPNRHGIDDGRGAQQDHEQRALTSRQPSDNFSRHATISLPAPQSARARSRMRRASHDAHIGIEVKHAQEGKAHLPPRGRLASTKIP